MSFQHRAAAAFVLVLSIQSTAVAADCRSDVRQLETAIVKRHAEPFRFTSPATFHALADSLANACATASPGLRYFGLARLAAVTGDSHTGVDVPEGLARFPIRLNWFGDTLRVVNATSDYKSLLGARVTGIATISLDSAVRALAPFIAQHENAGFISRVSASMLTYASALGAAGVIRSEITAPWQFVTDTGKVAVELPATADKPVLLSAARSIPRTCERGERPVWLETFADDKLVFLKFNAYPGGSQVRQIADSLTRALDAVSATKLVVDFRLNGGGNYKEFDSELLPLIRRRVARDKLRVFVLVGRATQSAPVVNAIHLRASAGAVIVGEPTGGRPNMLAEPTRFTLDFSGLGAAVSTKHNNFVAGDPDALMPDVPVMMTWDDYRAGRDPAFARILTL